MRFVLMLAGLLPPGVVSPRRLATVWITKPDPGHMQLERGERDEGE